MIPPTIKWVIIIIILCISVLSFLFFSTKLPNERKNGFNRIFFQNEPKMLNQTTVDPSLDNICGSTGDAIFISGEDPRAILVLRKNLQVRDTLIAGIDVPLSRIVPHFIAIDSPWIYLHFNNLKKAFIGKFPNQKLDSVLIQSQIFSKSIQISPSSLIIRSISSDFTKQVFQKIDSHTGRILMENDIINGQTDAGISSDGIIVYDTISSKLVFVQYLNHKFYCIDTNLNLLYQGRTIDTISSSDVAMSAQLNKNGSAKMVASEARIVVNKAAYISDNRLFILSGLRADNETLDKFNKYSSLDVYDLKNGEYTGSMHINKELNKPFKSALISRDTLFALYNKKIFVYRLPHEVYQ